MKQFSEKTQQDILASTALFDVIQDLVFLMEEDHETFRYVYANPAAFKTLQLHENILGSSLEEVLSPDQAQTLIEHYRKVQTLQKPFEFTQRMEVPEGELIGETVLSPILSEDGHCRFVLAIVRDVSERELKERELQTTKNTLEKDRKRLNSLIENNGDAVFEFDLDGNFLSINSIVTEISGFDEKELIGNPFVPLIVEEYLESTLQNFEKALKGQTLEYETAIIKKNKEQAILRISSIPIIIDQQVTGIFTIAKDITELIRMERLLKENEQRYKSLFHYHPHGIFTYDKLGNIVGGNAEAERITGFLTSELPQKTFMNHIMPQDIGKVREHFSQVIQQKRTVSYELSLRHKEGHQVDIQTMNIPIKVDGELVGIYGVLTDVSEPKRAQQALIETNEKLEVFWKNTTDPVFFIDTKGDILKVNPAFEQTFLYTEEEMVNKKGTIIPPHLTGDPSGIIERVNNGESVNSHETVRMTKNGDLLNIIASYTPVRNATKEIIGATIFYKDVTELKKAEKALQKSNEKYQLITESAFDVITLISPTGMIEYVSPSYEKTFGYPDSEYLGQPYITHVHPEDAFGFIETLTALMDGGKPVTTEIRFLHQNGEYIWMEVSPTLVKSGGTIKQLLTIAREITERKRLQDKIARMAFYDHLTEIPNRRIFDDHLQKAIHQAERTGRKVAVLMLDGRKFKRINDQFGHDAGDAVLKEMAARLQASIRPGDTAARLGGDEMGVILPELESLHVAETIAKRILSAFEEPFHFNGSQISIGAGIGISIYPDHSTSERQLIKYADLALYEAKSLDGNYFKTYS